MQISLRHGAKIHSGRYLTLFLYWEDSTLVWYNRLHMTLLIASVSPITNPDKLTVIALPHTHCDYRIVQQTFVNRYLI